MKNHRINRSFALRSILFLVLYLAVCFKFGYLEVASREQFVRGVLCVLCLYTLLPICFLPEIRRFVDFQRGLSSPKGEEALTSFNWLVKNFSLVPITGRAQALSSLGKYKEAKADADIAIQIAPDVCWTWSTRAAILAEQMDYDSAADDINKAVELAPNNSDVLVKRAYIHACRHQTQACLEDCEKIELLGKGDGYVRLLKIDCYLDEGNFAAAEATAKSIKTKVKPGSLDAYSLAIIKAHQNKYDEILSICTRVSDDNYLAYWFLLYLAEAYRHLNEGEMAMHSLKRAIGLKPKMPNAYGFRALALADAGFLDQALAECQRKDVMRYQNGLRSSSAYVRYFRKEFDAMLSCTEHGIKILPNASYGLSLHSMALTGLGRTDEAIEHATRATKLSRFQTMAWYALAEAQLKLDQVDQAIKSLNTGLATNPHHRFSYQLRANAHKQAGRSLEAEQDQAKFDEMQKQYLVNFILPR